VSKVVEKESNYCRVNDDRVNVSTNVNS